MKGGVTAFISILILVLVGLTIFTVSGRNIRKSELDKSLTNAIEQTMEVIYLEKSYTVANKDELAADLTGNLLTQLSSDSNIEIKILNVDFVNGCLDVQAIEKFKYFTGKEGIIEIRKTVIFEQYNDPNDRFYEVRFLNKDGTLFRQIQVYNEGRLTAPSPGPANLIRWELVDNAEWDGDFSKIIVTRNLTFKAVCN